MKRWAFGVAGLLCVSLAWFGEYDDAPGLILLASVVGAVLLRFAFTGSTGWSKRDIGFTVLSWVGFLLILAVSYELF